MNSKSINGGNNSGSKDNPGNSINLGNSKKIKRRNFFVYLGAGALGAIALTKLPFKLFQQKLKAEASIKVKVNPYAVKRDMSKKVQDTKGQVNG